MIEGDESIRDSLICWWCVHDLPQHPCIHLPIKYDDKRKIFGTIGNFCSWACSKAYALDMRTAKSGEIQSLLALMRKHTYGKSVPCWPAPKREALACFGGTMTIEQFRSFGGFVEPPRIHYPFEKLYFATSMSTMGRSETVHGVSPLARGGTHLQDIKTSSVETETLRLKRNKPLVRSTSKLENSLGIKRRGKEDSVARQTESL